MKITTFPERLNERGSMIVQALIAVAIMAIIMAAFSSTLVNQLREAKSLNQKFAAMDLEKVLLASLADGSVCKYIANTPAALSFNSAQVLSNHPQLIAPSLPIYASVDVGPPLVLGPIVAEKGKAVTSASDSLVVKNIQLVIDKGPPIGGPPGPGKPYTGFWEVTLDPASLVRPLKPIRIATTLMVDTTVPAAAIVQSCQGDLGAGGGGGAGAMGYEIVHNSCNDPAQSVPNMFVIPNPSEGICGALCPAGKVAVAGGGFVGDGYVSLSAMGHTTGGGNWMASQQGWVVAGAGPIIGPWSCGGWNSCRVVLHVWAGCVKK